MEDKRVHLLPIRANENTYYTEEDNIMKVKCVYGDETLSAFDKIVNEIRYDDFKHAENNKAFASYCVEEGSLLDEDGHLGITMHFHTDSSSSSELTQIFRDTLGELLDVVICMQIMTYDDSKQSLHDFGMDAGPFSVLLGLYSLFIERDDPMKMDYLSNEADKFKNFIVENEDSIEDDFSEYVKHVLCIRKKSRKKS
jgi:hypothetical protein